MKTIEKLESYENAMSDWRWRFDAWNSTVLRGTAPTEPSPNDFGLRGPDELWAAAKIRARYVQPNQLDEVVR